MPDANELKVLKHKKHELEQAVKIYDDILHNRPRDLLEGLDQYFTMRFFSKDADAFDSINIKTEASDGSYDEEYLKYESEITRLEEQLQQKQVKFHEKKFMRTR